LAEVLCSKTNFLLLDKPTNHLDMVSIKILAQTLQQYAGTYLLVSHDRHFVAKVANKIWYIEGKQIKKYAGTCEECTRLQRKTAWQYATTSAKGKQAYSNQNSFKQYDRHSMHCIEQQRLL
jgi:ATP-binding cassette, subfamily F, member 3